MEEGPSPIDQAIPDSLPLLDDFVEEWIGGEKPLAGVTAVLIQHQLGSQVRMTEAMIRLGLDPRRIFWVDIPYTANGEVHAALRGLGIPENNFSPSYYHLEMPYASYQHLRVQELALGLLQSLPDDAPLLVMDDGSYFLEAMSCFSDSIPGMRIVEQTTRGVIKIRHDAALRHCSETVPILNVAESRPKKEIEGPLIGEAVCKGLIEKLEARLSFGPDTVCLILGFGHIGQSVAASLTDQLGVAPGQIHVLDPDGEAQARAIARGLTIWHRGSSERVRFELLVGCSGTTSFSVGDRAYLADGAVLASASSGSAELSREGFIELADNHPGADVYVHDRARLALQSVHSDIRIHLVDRDAVFLNGGFPVNFDGRVNCVEPRFIQVTHTLQVGAAVEAMRTTECGLVEVSEELCQWVEERAHRGL